MSIVFGQFAGLLQQVVRAIPLVGQVFLLAGALRADRKRERAVVERGSQGPGDGLHLGDAGYVEHRLGHPVQDEHVGRVAHVMIRFDHQQFGLQPGAREVPLGSRVTDIGRRAGGHVGARVVTGLVSGQREQADEGHRARRRENGSGPADDGRADPPPSAGSHRALRVEDAYRGAQGEHGRAQGKRGEQRDEDADAAGMPRLWKYGSRVKLRQKTAPATVRPEPRTMWAVPRNMV